MLLKRFFLSLLTVLAVACLLPAQVIALTLSSPSAILLDTRTGQVLFTKDADVVREPASLTKMMTAMVVFDAIAAGEITLETRFTISENAVNMERAASRMGLVAGENVNVHLLLQGLLAVSGNDAAAILAENIANDATSNAGFITRMNAKAKSLGMSSTQFHNAGGLPAQGQVTTAADMAKLVRHLQQQYPQYAAYFNLPRLVYDNKSQENHNPLLSNRGEKSAAGKYAVAGVDGMKTGHTRAAGYHLAATQTTPVFTGAGDRHDWKLLFVSMGAGSQIDRARDGQALLAYAHANYQPVLVYSKNQVIGSERVYQGAAKTVNLVPEQDVWLTLPKGLNLKNLTATYVLDADNAILKAPIAEVQRLGSLTLWHNGNAQIIVPVVAQTEVLLGGWLDRVWDWLAEIYEGVFL